LAITLHFTHCSFGRYAERNLVSIFKPISTVCKPKSFVVLFTEVKKILWCFICLHHKVTFAVEYMASLKQSTITDISLPVLF